jgi:uncharacterized membrane protein
MDSKKKREAEAAIKQALQGGKSKDQILADMAKNHYEKLAIGKLIAGIPYPENKKRFKLLNNVLILLLGLLLSANVFEGYLSYGEGPVMTIIGSLVLVLISIYFFHGLIKFRGNTYYELSQLLVLVIIVELNRIAELNIWVIAQTILIVLVLGIAIIIRKKLFPGYGFFGLKKGKDGYYLIG